MAAYKYDESIYVDGRRYRIRANTQKEFAAKVADIREKAERGTYKKVTVKEWREEWVEEYKRPDVSDDWYKQVKRYLEKLHDIDHIRLVDIKPLHLKKLLNKEAGKSFSSVKKVYDIFRELFRQAYIEGLVPADITIALTMPTHRKQGGRRAITQQERAAFLGAIPKHEKGLFFAIMLFAGLRPSEVRALKFCDIDRKRREITVSKALTRSAQRKDTKTFKGDRVVPYFAELDDFLPEGEPFDYVVPNRKGGPMTYSSYDQMWKAFSNLLHVEMGGELYRGAPKPPYGVADDLTPYCLRHTFCTDLEKAGVPINIACRIMGHADVSTTSRIYTHYDTETADIASAIMNPGTDSGQTLDNDRRTLAK